MSLLWLITPLLSLILAAAGDAHEMVAAVARTLPTPTPVATPVASSVTRAPVGSPVDAFIAGYRDGGGDPRYEEHWINDVIPCESEWDVDPPGYYLGLAQFAPGTWVWARCSIGAEYTDPYQQGCAVARWMAMIPGRWGTRAGWPVCWWR